MLRLDNRSPGTENVTKAQNCKRPAVPQMRARFSMAWFVGQSRGLRSVLVAHELADDSVQYPLEGYKAYVVLLNAYAISV